MALHRGTEGSEPVARRFGGQQELRRTTRSDLGQGTIACPRCDAPVALAASPLAPSDPLACPFCRHGGALRDFLTLGEPTRPTRVTVRVVHRARGAVR